MKGRKRRMNGLQKEIENRHLPELMRLENGDAEQIAWIGSFAGKKLKSYFVMNIWE